MKVSFVNGKNAIIGELNVSPHGCNKIAQESRGPNAVTIKKKKKKSQIVGIDKTTVCNRFPDNKCPFISRRISTVSQHTCNLYRLFAKHRFMIHESKKRIFDEIYGRARLIRGKLWKRANNKCVDAHCLFVGKEKKKKVFVFLSLSPSVLEEEGSRCTM